jgi:uncharacterized protein (TIRG00374 family)
LKWAAAALVLGLLLYFLPLAPLRAAVKRVPPPRFFEVLLAYVLVHAVGVAKWRMVVNAAGAQLDLATSVQCYAGGMFGTLFLPSIVGGDAVRLAVGLQRSPRPAAVLAGNVVDRILDAAAQAALVLAGLILLPGALRPQLGATARTALLAATGAVFLLLVLAFVSRRPLLAGRSIRFRRCAARLRSAVRSVAQRPQVLAFGWLLGAVIQTAFLLLTAFLAVECGLALPLRVWFFAWPLAKLAAVLPLTQGGIGVREAALVALLAPFGAAGHLVLAAGLVWEGIVIAGGLIAGAIASVMRRIMGSRLNP